MFAEFLISRIGKVSTAQVDKYKSHYRAHFAHRWDNVDDMAAMGAVDAYASDRLAGRSPAVEIKKVRPRPKSASTSTVAKELVTARVFLKWCRKRGIIDAMPEIEEVQVVSDYRQPDYSTEDVQRLLAAIPDRATHRRHFPAREFYTVQWAQAFRPGELESLRWQDVNLRDHEVTVRQSEDKARVGRTVGLADQAHAILTAMAKIKPLPSAPVFGDRDFRRSLENAAKACGLPRPTPHSLRHFRLTELGHAPTTAPAALKFFAGHRRLDTTVRYLRGRTDATKGMLAALPQSPAKKGRR